MSKYKVENEIKKMRKQNVKSVLTSILVGACVAFLSTLFEGLAVFFKTHSTEVVAGGVTAFYHTVKTFKI